ncbi:MAG: T9SS type A sorting domain-containing protein [Bacteroidales bacterium]|nr:T9SS type A sorting domain-containing protein [Bacteroidales bacterium]
MKNCFITLFLLAGALLAAAQSPDQLPDHQGNTQRIAHQYPPGGNLFHEGGNPWVSVGPFGGDVVDLAIDPLNPDVLFAAAGLPFVSDDGGDTWSILTELAGISSGIINSFETTGNGTIFATALYIFGKVFRSTNGGSSWHTRNIPVNSNALCLAGDPGDTSTIYVGLATNVSYTTNKVIVRSTDAGGTWTAFDLTSVLPVGWSVIDICVDPDDSQTIFAVANSGFSDAKIVATFNGGQTWEDRTANLPLGIPYNAVAIAGQEVFVAGGQLFGSQYMGVYQSTDYGVSWTNISSSFPNKVSNTILIDDTDINNIYVGTEGDGIYYSTDGGSSWNFDASGAGETGAARCLSMKPGAPDQLYAGFLSLALCRSSDAGLTWEFANNGIATLQVDDIEINPLDPVEVLVGFEAENSGGCYLSNDGGESWNLVSGLPGTRFSQVTFGADGDLYAWSNGPSTVAQEGLYKSTDGGVNWSNMGPNIGNLFETEIFSLTASATDPDLIFIGGNNFGVNGWAPVIYRSSNGGQDWINTYVGLPDDFYSIRFLFIDPDSDDEIIYAGYKSEVQGGFLKSTDSGNSWSEIGAAIPYVYKWGGAIVCRPDNSDLLLAGCGGYGHDGTIYISADGGASWSSTNLGLGTYSKVADILIHPVYTGFVYCASSQDGVQISTDGGMVWTPANDGLTSSNITGFSNPFLSGTEWYCYAATSDNSAFRTKLADPWTGIPDDRPDPGILIFPNPTNGMFRITTPGKEEVQKLEVIAATGQTMLTLEREELNLDESWIRVEFPPGIYLLKIYLGEITVSEKLIIRK